jgi:hypothetical protein
MSTVSLLFAIYFSLMRIGFDNLVRSRGECFSLYIHEFRNFIPCFFRVIMCLFCGDPFGPERLLAPLVGTKTCIQTGERSVLMDQEVRRGLARKCFNGFLLKHIVADPGSDAFLTTGSGIQVPGCVKNQDLDHISERFETIFRLQILKFYYADPESY